MKKRSLSNRVANKSKSNAAKAPARKTVAPRREVKPRASASLPMAQQKGKAMLMKNESRSKHHKVADPHSPDTVNFNAPNERMLLIFECGRIQDAVEKTLPPSDEFRQLCDRMLPHDIDDYFPTLEELKTVKSHFDALPENDRSRIFSGYNREGITLGDWNFMIEVATRTPPREVLEFEVLGDKISVSNTAAVYESNRNIHLHIESGTSKQEALNALAKIEDVIEHEWEQIIVCPGDQFHKLSESLPHKRPPAAVSAERLDAGIQSTLVLIKAMIEIEDRFNILSGRDVVDPQVTLPEAAFGNTTERVFETTRVLIERLTEAMHSQIRYRATTDLHGSDLRHVEVPESSTAELTTNLLRDAHALAAKFSKVRHATGDVCGALEPRIEHQLESVEDDLLEFVKANAVAELVDAQSNNHP